MNHLISAPVLGTLWLEVGLTEPQDQLEQHDLEVVQLEKLDQLVQPVQLEQVFLPYRLVQEPQQFLPQIQSL